METKNSTFGRLFGSFFSFDTSDTSIAATCFFWLTLGFLGVHRIYAGSVASGVLMGVISIASFGVFASSIGTENAAIGFSIWLAFILWWLIDAVLIVMSYGRQAAHK